MSFSETLLVILRRWWVSGPALALALALGTAAFMATPKTYQDETQLLFLRSAAPSGEEKTAVNPFLEFSGTLISTADIIRVSVSTADETKELAGGRGKYLVALDTTTPAPVLDITSTAATPAVAREIQNGVLDAINRQLIAKQKAAGAAPDLWVRTTVISSIPKPKPQYKSPVRSAILAFMGFLVIVLSIIFFVEGRRARRRSARATVPAYPPPVQLPAHGSLDWVDRPTEPAAREVAVAGRDPVPPFDFPDQQPAARHPVPQAVPQPVALPQRARVEPAASTVEAERVRSSNGYPTAAPVVFDQPEPATNHARPTRAPATQPITIPRIHPIRHSSASKQADGYGSERKEPAADQEPAQEESNGRANGSVKKT